MRPSRDKIAGQNRRSDNITPSKLKINFDIYSINMRPFGAIKTL